MEQAKLNKILELHQKWRKKEIGGKRANLNGADLSKEDLT